MGNDGGGEKDMTVTEYEKQRLLRIRENKARLEALRLPGIASSFRKDNLSKQDQVYYKRKKKNKDDGEEEYQPSDEDDEEETMDDRSSEEEDDDMPSSSSTSRRKGKSSIASNDQKLSKVSRFKRGRKDGDLIDDDDDDAALAQAIALSLGESVENKNSEAKVQNKAEQIRKSLSSTKEPKRTNKKPSKSRIQLSEDEVIGFFFSFDEVGKGYITAYDIEKMAISHDFSWTDSEIAKMVRSFDSDGDRKLSLEDFRSIVCKCHMLRESD